MDVHSYPAPGCDNSKTQVRACGEFGGIGCQVPGHLWNPALAGGNYTKANDTSELIRKYDGFINDLTGFKSNQGLSAGVYTEITDVENECNGLLTYDRVMKADVDLIRASNRKAITGQLFISAVVPTSQDKAITWKYTTQSPAGEWFSTGFDDGSWSSGEAGFGTEKTAPVRTEWTTPDIWIRRDFTLGALSAKDLEQLNFSTWHDEDCEIYINGVLAAEAKGFSTSYVMLPMNDAGKAALVQNGKNVIAIHCHQTVGGQYIDVGLSKIEFQLDAAASK